MTTLLAISPSLNVSLVKRSGGGKWIQQLKCRLIDLIEQHVMFVATGPFSIVYLI